MKYPLIIHRYAQRINANQSNGSPLVVRVLREAPLLCSLLCWMALALELMMKTVGIEYYEYRVFNYWERHFDFSTLLLIDLTMLIMLFAVLKCFFVLSPRNDPFWVFNHDIHINFIGQLVELIQREMENIKDSIKKKKKKKHTSVRRCKPAKDKSSTERINDFLGDWISSEYFDYDRNVKFARNARIHSVPRLSVEGKLRMVTFYLFIELIHWIIGTGFSEFWNLKRLKIDPFFPPKSYLVLDHLRGHLLVRSPSTHTTVLPLLDRSIVHHAAHVH